MTLASHLQVDYVHKLWDSLPFPYVALCQEINAKNNHDEENYRNDQENGEQNA